MQTPSHCPSGRLGGTVTPEQVASGADPQLARASAALQQGDYRGALRGRSGRLLRTYTGRIPDDTFGFDAVGMGTRDDSGQAELLITSGWSAVHGFHTGRIFLIASGIEGSAGSGAALK